MAILSYRAWTAFSRETGQLAITREVVDRTNTLLSSLKDAETGQRGYLLTGDDRYLQPYRQALADIPVSLNALTSVAAGRNPELAHRVDSLRPLVQERLAELKETLDARREKGPEAALAIVMIDRGKVVMDRIRLQCLDIQSFTNIRLTEYSGEDRASASELGLLSTIGSACLFLLLVFSTFTIQRATHRRQQLIQDLQESEARTKQARDWLQTTIGSIGDGVV
ncbi:MAG: CHASE3 domain-containing protein, partial [Bryobacteraceae bacterium]